MNNGEFFIFAPVLISFFFYSLAVFVKKDSKELSYLFIGIGLVFIPVTTNMMYLVGDAVFDVGFVDLLSFVKSINLWAWRILKIVIAGVFAFFVVKLYNWFIGKKDKIVFDENKDDNIIGGGLF